MAANRPQTPNKHLYRPVADEVRYARRRRGLTQGELGKIMGLGSARGSHTTISLIERGGHGPTVTTLVKIAEATNMQLRITFTPLEELEHE
jgi:transcriptional regulator with XRE-family HTH domain